MRDEFKKFRVLINNDRGAMLIQALIAIAVSALVVLGATTSADLVRSQARRTRLRSTMAVFERNIRERLAQPFSFVNCVSATGPSSCDVDWNYLAAVAGAESLVPPGKTNALVFRFPLSYAPCPAETPGCGLALIDAQFIATSATQPVFRATLVYEGTDISIKPISIQMRLWKELVQEDVFQCSAGFFAGFDASGRPMCYQPAACSGWTMATSIDSALNATECMNLPTGVSGSERLSSVTILLSTPAHALVFGGPRKPVSWWNGKL